VRSAAIEALVVLDDDESTFERVFEERLSVLLDREALRTAARAPPLPKVKVCERTVRFKESAFLDHPKHAIER